ncbi:MAG: GNAT family N-acetyltransferase [Myxococcota bacterium]
MGRPERLFEDLPRPAPFGAADVLAELDDGLVLRRANAADTEAVVAFNRAVHADPPDYPPEEYAAAWTRELMDGRHPSMRAQDFVLVEDVKAGRIASCLCLVSHRLHFGGVELAAGQPELVGTRPEYRRRGLVARQFEVIHRWSEERGQRLQLIDGIPWFYRQFGYEMALEQAQGRRVHAPELDAGVPAPDVRVRPAQVGDAALLAEVQARSSTRHRLSCRRSEAFWRYELTARDAMSMRSRLYKVLETEGGEPLAALVHYPILNRTLLPVNFCERTDEGSWSSLLPALFTELRREGEAFAARDGGSFEGANLLLGSQHPLYEVAGSRAATPMPSSAWYVRVPDLPGFLREVAPALEAHLENSPAAGHSGRLDVSLYRSGLRLVLEAGRLVAVESWQPSTDERGHVALPGLTFLQLLFGLHPLSELRRFWPDCVVRDEVAGAVLSALLPPQPSDLLLTD